jgi:2-keto-4-pentenoate hydratase
MLDGNTIQAIVSDIEGVYESRKPLPLLTKTYPGISVDDSYRIQAEFVRRCLERGRRVRGYKVGLTSKAMQVMASATEPDYSAMTDDLFVPEGSELEMARFFRPLIEIEIAFVMREPLKGPGVLPVDVIRATDFVLPSIEVVDFRVGPGPGMTIVDTVADLAACGVAVLGANPRRLDQLDLGAVKGQMLINGEVVQEGLGSAVLGHPVTSIAWLANKLGSLGVTFEPGQVILSGSIVRAMPVKAGDAVVAAFDQGLGAVQATFV